MDPKTLLNTYRDGLLEDVVPFWLSHSLDHEHGGYLTSLNADGTVIDTDKGIWQQGRGAWLFAKLYNEVETNDVWLQAAELGARFLLQHGFDSADGRLWFHVTREGQPIRKRRYSFSECFAAVAFGELAQATGKESYREKAVQCFAAFVDATTRTDPVSPKFTDARPMRSIGSAMITINTAQELRESIGLKDANRWIDASIETIERFHMRPEIRCVIESVGINGERLDHFEGRQLNPGHAIEAAWFIMKEGQVRSDTCLIEMGCQMLDWMWERGWDQEYGGLLYFVDVDGLPVSEYWHDMKFWWPHNEAIIATLMAFQLTGNEKYAGWHRLVHDWAYTHFPDAEHGEWFGYLHRDGTVSSRLKGNLWKGPFHLPRMQLLGWRIAESL